MHVEASDSFTLENCTFDRLVGRALRVTRSVLSHFTNVRVMRCGATGQPAVHLDGSGVDVEVVQGSTFTGFRVEGCFSEPYVRIESTGQDSENTDNKFDEFGFESYEDGNPGYDPETSQTFLDVAALRNQFGKLHFNRVADDTAAPRLRVSANHCAFGELQFAGVKGPGGSVEVSGSYNAFGSIVLVSAVNDPPVPTEIRISGDGNRIGSIRCDPHDSATGSDLLVGGISIEGAGNVVQSIGARYLQGLTITGSRNVVRSFTSESAPTTALTVRGEHTTIAHAHIEACTVEGSPVVEVLSPPNAGKDWPNHSRLRVQVVDATYATDGVFVATGDVQLLPGSAIQGITNGQGLRWSGPRGGWRGLTIEEVGKDGILVEGGTPLAMHDWTARSCGRLSNPATPQWGGFRATAPAFAPEPAVCTGFQIQHGTSAHLYSLLIEQSTVGGLDHKNWRIRGNDVDGGPAVIPTTIPHSVDFDAEGRGADITVTATTIAMPDSANFVRIVPSSGDVETITASWPGRRVTLLFTGAQTVKSGVGNLRLQGGSDFAATSNDTLTLIVDGTSWYEVTRSVN